MNEQELYDLGMQQYDSGDFKRAVVNLEAAVSQGHQQAFSILDTLYTVPEFGINLSPSEVYSKALEFSDKGNLFARLHIAKADKSLDDISHTVSEIEKMSLEKGSDSFDGLGPGYIQVVMALDEIHSRHATMDIRPAVRKEILRCLEQCEKFARKYEVQQLLFIATQMASQFQF